MRTTSVFVIKCVLIRKLQGSYMQQLRTKRKQHLKNFSLSLLLLLKSSKINTCLSTTKWHSEPDRWKPDRTDMDIYVKTDEYTICFSYFSHSCPFCPQLLHPTGAVAFQWLATSISPFSTFVSHMSSHISNFLIYSHKMIILCICFSYLYFNYLAHPCGHWYSSQLIST